MTGAAPGLSLRRAGWEAPDRDLTKAHPLLRQRWAQLGGILLARGFKTIIWECFRSEERQAWLYGQGRTATELVAVGLDPSLARPGEIVTHAYHATLSAHGWRLPDGLPAAAALDLVPLGPSDRSWGPDAPWASFTALVEAVAPATGLRHFRKAGKITDAPHVELYPEWSNASHRLTV